MEENYHKLKSVGHWLHTFYKDLMTETDKTDEILSYIEILYW